MAGAEEPGCERNVEHGQCRLAQHWRRMLDPDREKVALQRVPELA